MMRYATGAAAVVGCAAVLLMAAPALAAPAVPAPSTVAPAGTGPDALPDPAAGLPTAPPAKTAAAQPTSPALLAARRAADALQAKVDALQAATEQAVEHYNAVAADLRVARDRHRRAAADLAAAQRAQAAADRAADQRIRSLYISGGPPGLMEVTVNGAPGLELFNRFDDAGFVVAQDRARLTAATAAAARSAAAERALAGALAAQQRLTVQAAAARKTVETALARTRSLLDSASKQVRELLAEEQRAAARAAAALAAAVRAAQAHNGGSGAAFAVKAPLSPFVQKVLGAAEAQLGKPYRWGATGPSSYDCSGLVQYAFAAAGVALPRTARDQWLAGSHPAGADAQPGDLLFWASTAGDASTIHHVAIYLGGGYMLAAPHTGTVVSVQSVYTDGFFGITRVGAPASR